MDSTEPPAGANAVEAVKQYNRIFQSQLDRTTPFPLYRWGSSVALFLLFTLRIFWVQAYYIVAYALGIYLLNLFLAFITPKFDPALEADLAETDAEEGAPTLPTSKGDVQEDGEFRPFIRRLPEFKFWYSATKAITLAFFAAFIPVFDVPVFWPILVMYFCILTFITLRRQVAHMRKYKYLPASTPPRSSGSPTSCVTRPGVLMVLGVFPQIQIPPVRHGSEIDIRSLKRGGGGGGRRAKARRDERTLLGGCTRGRGHIVCGHSASQDSLLPRICIFHHQKPVRRRNLVCCKDDPSLKSPSP